MTRLAKREREWQKKKKWFIKCTVSVEELCEAWSGLGRCLFVVRGFLNVFVNKQFSL